MKKGTWKEEEEDEETRSEEREASILGRIEAYRKDLESHLTIHPARQEGPGTAKAGPFPLTEDRKDLVFDLASSGYPSNTIMEIMGVDNGGIDRLELEEYMKEGEFGMLRMSQGQGKEEGRKIRLDDDENFEAYDPVKWETATEEENVDRARDEKNVPELHLPHTDEAIPETSEPEFVRALKDSKMGSKPYFRKGHILRVINKARHGKLSDKYFELLPLKPPGEAGKALIQHFEPADQAAADEVGREARTDKEVDSFRYAMDWED